jgi:Ser/Thr protein kinase RdoA (MazF antagonist)
LIGRNGGIEMNNVSTNTWDSSVEFFNQVSERALLHYTNVNDLTAELLDYSENATYLIRNTNTGVKQILRVCRPNYHMKQQIESEVKWVKATGENTPINVPKPIAALNGEYIQTVKLDGQDVEYHCVMFSFLEGKMPEIDNEDQLIEVFEVIGEMAAQLHEDVFRNWNQFKEFKRPIWNYENILGEKPIWGRWQDGIAITPERLKLFTRVADVIKLRLERFGQNPERFGLIHADLRHANLLVNGDEVNVIDFDDSGFGWYLADVASSLTLIEHRSSVPVLIESWLKGYRKVRSLSEEEENEIPTFIMMRRLQIIAWAGSRDNKLTEELGSEYTRQADAMAKAYLDKFENSQY